MKDFLTKAGSTILRVVVFVIAYIIARTISMGLFTNHNINQYEKNTINQNIQTNNTQTNKFSKEEVNDAYKVRGFYLVNTKFLSEYCTETGYIPNSYINLFEQRFFNTIYYHNEIIDSIDSNEIQQKIEKKLRPQLFKQYDNDLKIIQEEIPDYTKWDYCSLYDENQIEIVEEKINIFNQNFPHLFKD